MTALGILLTNTGTPDAPSPKAVRRYLREFLSDKRIIKLPRLIWWPILYSVVLPLRPYYSAKLYQRIWTAEGSPMRYFMGKLVERLQEKMTGAYHIEIGMNYGNPSIPQALKKLQEKNVEKIIVLPLYPQYSDTTTASSFDRVNEILKQWRTVSEICMIRDYANHPAYIAALAASMQTSWQQHGQPDYTLFSFHGLPERYTKSGDPYAASCASTAQKVAEKLQLPREKWALCFQSRFGYNKWLKPATLPLLAELAQRGIHHVGVICPGFAVDCLETLEEIAIRGRETFLQAGGKRFHYIPALNETDAHVEMLAAIIGEYYG